MLNLALSLVVSLIVNLALYRLAGLEIWLSTLISLAVFAGIYLLAVRIVMKKLGALMETAQRDIQAQRWEKAIRTLQSGMKYAPWQFYIKGQIKAQIGTILFLKRDFAEAFEYLKQSFVRHWVAMGMLAVCYMKRNKTSQMIDTFEKATSANKKEPMLWALYAYCLDRVGERAKAIDALERGLRRVKDDERLKENLELLQAGKRMKMKDFGDLWYQFHLEKPGALIKKQTKAIQGRRKVVRR
jgi:tetratricopeptide (TPR) repeat protein